MTTQQPPPEVVAAIVAAVELAWPRQVTSAEEGDGSSAWRFSNRWWVPRRSAVDRRRP